MNEIKNSIQFFPKVKKKIKDFGCDYFLWGYARNVCYRAGFSFYQNNNESKQYSKFNDYLCQLISLTKVNNFLYIVKS